MSRKYFDKLMTGSGTSNQKVKSKFGEAMLKKMGWQDGKGLGKEANGEVDCVQVKRREENSGLGFKEEKKGFSWNDAFWVDMYDNIAKKLNQKFNSDDEKSKEETTEETAQIKKYDSFKITCEKLENSLVISKKDKKEERKKKKELYKKKKESFKMSQN